MEKSQWRLTSRSIWQAGSIFKLTSALVLLTWAGTSSITSARSTDIASKASPADYFLPASLESSKPMLAGNRRAEAQDLRAAASAIKRESSGRVAPPPRAVAADAHSCLALNVYWEARNQSVAGQLAVAQVTLNRVADPRYADNVCDVVYQHKQFSWYWDGKPDTPKEHRAWETAFLVASAALAGSGHVEVQGVTHYHAVYSKPFWKDHMVRVATIGDHIFYAE
jgi:spore germination cell wall hydrolase CwlJ-like protein